MDRQSVYTLSLGFSQASEAGEEPDSRQHIQQQLVDFILEFQIDNVFLYRYAFLWTMYRPRMH